MPTYEVFGARLPEGGTWPGRSLRIDVGVDRRICGHEEA